MSSSIQSLKREEYELALAVEEQVRHLAHVNEEWVRIKIARDTALHRRHKYQEKLQEIRARIELAQHKEVRAL